MKCLSTEINQYSCKCKSTSLCTVRNENCEEHEVTYYLISTHYLDNSATGELDHCATNNYMLVLLTELISLSRLSTVIVDEADTLLDDSFSNITCKALQQLQVR